MTNENLTPAGEPVQPVSTGLVLSPKVYEGLKWFVLIFLPAFSALYFGLSAIWNLPAAEQVVGTCAVLGTFIGVLVGVSNRNFQRQGADGSLNAVVEGDQVVLSRLALPHITPEQLASKKSITIQVNPAGTTGLSQ